MGLSKYLEQILDELILQVQLQLSEIQLCFDGVINKLKSDIKINSVLSDSYESKERYIYL